jgi:DNA (cytosine-5)-methyltransferase 1
MFELIDKVNNSKKKKFFLEKINIYIKLVELISRSLNLKLFKNNYKFNKKTFLRICELNIYKSNVKDNNKLLVQILKKNLYQQFIAAINFNVKYKRKIGNLLDKFDDTKRNIININNEKKNKFTLVDFFCGAGGFSYGFVQENFKIELANDNDWECIETYKLNHPEILDKKIIRDDIKKIINRLDKFLPSPIDVVIGGPPCQGFSNANQQRIINDPRNKLYKYFISAVKKINPKIVVMENVKGMYPYAEQVKKILIIFLIN